MLTASGFQSHSASLASPTITPEKRRELANEVRNSIELVHSHDYSEFLTHYLPAFRTVLCVRTTPQSEDNSIHRTRGTILEILNRLPPNEILRGRLLDVFSLVMEVLQKDNEENAVSAIHIIFELHRNFRRALVTQVQPYLTFVRGLYEAFPATVNELLLRPTVPHNQPIGRRLFQSTQSFKVITECPLLVMFVFQLYPKCIDHNIAHLSPLMVRAIQLEVPPESQPPSHLYQEFLAAQVKTVSFLSYMIKNNSNFMKENHSRSDQLSIARSVVKLLRACPGDSVTIRKELLVATRHVLMSPSRDGFFDQIDYLLDESVLVGSSRTARIALRPLAYSFLAELIHTVRFNLNITQLQKIIHIFSTNVHDSNFAYNLQTSSVRLLMNLVEAVLKFNTTDHHRVEARNLLIRILETITLKYDSMGGQVPRLLKTVEDMRQGPDPVKSGKLLTELPLGDVMREVAEFKLLLKTLNSGAKTIIWSLMNIRPAERHFDQSSINDDLPTTPGTSIPGPEQDSNSSTNKGLNEKERELVARLLPASRNVFRLFSRSEKANGGTGNDEQQPNTDESNFAVSSKRESIRSGTACDNSEVSTPATVICATASEERDIFEHFAAVFTVLDVGSFQDIFGLRMQEIFEHVVASPQAIIVPQNFLVIGNVSKYFADILLNFLVENLDFLDVPADDANASTTTLRTRRASAVLRLFRLLSASINLIPMNEPVLRRHATAIVQKTLKYARDAEDPHGYLQMLRALFKAVGHRKNDSHFDAIYRDLCPFIEPVFLALTDLYNAPNHVKHKALIIELCLMVPARQSTIFPFLHLQMRPVMWALLEQPEQASTAIRNLEYWVNMLQPDYLDEVLSGIEPNFINILQRHLYSSDSSVAKAVGRVLGKLGPRARLEKLAVAPFSFEAHSGKVQYVGLKWPDGTKLSVNMDKIITLSTDTLLNRRKVSNQPFPWSHKRKAWKLLFSLMTPIIGSDSCNMSASPDFGIRFRLDASSFVQLRSKPRSKYSNRAESDVVLKMLTALLATGHSHEMQVLETQDQSHFSQKLEGLCRYFAALVVQDIIARSHEDRKAAGLQVDIQEEHSWRSLSPSIFISAVTDVLSSQSDDFLSNGLLCLKHFLESLFAYSTGTSFDQGLKSGSSEAGFFGARFPEFADSHEGASTNCSVGEVPGCSGPASRFIPNRNDCEKLFAKSVADIVEQLCHCCYKSEWNAKRAGVRGLEQLVCVIPEDILKSQWFGATHLHIISSLLFLTKSSCEIVYPDIICRVRKVILLLIRLHFIPTDMSKVPNIISSKPFHEFTIRLGWELSCNSASTREIVRLCFIELSKLLAVPVIDILSPAKDQLFRILAQRSIRQYSFPTQTGYVEYVNFCLEHGQKSFASELLRHPSRENFISECIITLESSPFDAATELEEGFRFTTHESLRFLTRKTAKQLLLLRRRIITMLCNVAVFGIDEIPQTEKLLGSLITNFFRCLQSGDDEIVHDAKRGLKQAVLRHEKPKELLQQSLRPLLFNLRDHKKLTTSYLHSLSRILELFSHWFNVNLGDKLLEHLQRWTEPEKFGSQQKWTPGSESKVGAAILDLFHLLSPASEKFLESIVNMVINLESVLPVVGPGVAHLGLKSRGGASTSPYRKPLMNFCNQHASVAAQFFLTHMYDDGRRQLLFAMVRSSDSAPLQNALMESVQRSMENIVFPDDTTSNGLHLITLADFLSEHNPKWLTSQAEVMDKLKSYWRAAANSSEMSRNSTLSLIRVKEIETIVRIFIRYWNHCDEDVAILYELLPIYWIRTVCDFTYAKDFVNETVTNRVSAIAKRSILEYFLDMFQDKTISQERKVYALQQIVIPMVTTHLKASKFQPVLTDSDVPAESLRKDKISNRASAGSVVDFADVSQSRGVHALQISDSGTGGSVQPVTPLNDGSIAQVAHRVSESDLDSGITVSGSRQDDVLDALIIQRIMKDILDQPDDVLRLYDERLSAELLRLVAELIKHMPGDLGRHRKELIKFGWGHLKREDSYAKHWAFVNVTTFFRAYQAPGKIVLQVYVALLRACQPEGRELVHQALDILTPALPRRLSHNPSDHKFPIWIRYTKKVLLEEGHNTNNVIHILHLIARHQELFFIARSQFVLPIASSLSRIGLVPACPVENRRLCLDIIYVILKWERISREYENLDNITDNSNRKRAREDLQRITGVTSFKETAGAFLDAPTEALEPPTKLRRNVDGKPVSTGNSPHSNATSREADDYHTPRAVVELLFNFLVQAPFRAGDKREASIVLQRCIMLLEEGSNLWQECAARITYIDKIVDVHAREKASAANASVAANAPQRGPSSHNTDADSKVTKSDPNKLEKNDSSLRWKRTPTRPSSLMTALILMTTLTKHQEKRFIDTNIDAFRLSVIPALTDDDPQIVAQFVSLFREFCRHVPRPRHDTHIEDHTTPGASKPNQDGVNSAPTMEHDLSGKSQISSGPDAAKDPTFLYSMVHDTIETNLNSSEVVKVYNGLIVLETLTEAFPQDFARHRELVLKTVLKLTKDHLNVGQGNGSSSNAGQTSFAGTGRLHPGDVSIPSSLPGGAISHDAVHMHPSEPLRSIASARGEGITEREYDVCAIKLGISFISRNISMYEAGQRKAISTLLIQLIERCNKATILKAIIDLVQEWVYWSPSSYQKAQGISKDPVPPKEKMMYLQKMVSFERLSAHKSSELLYEYLELLLRIFGGRDSRDRKQDFFTRLERSFTIGMKCDNEVLRRQFFNIYSDALPNSFSARLRYIFSNQDWDLYGDWLWIRHACELLIATSHTERNFFEGTVCPRFPLVAIQKKPISADHLQSWRPVRDASLIDFLSSQQTEFCDSFLTSLRSLLFDDHEIAHVLWVELFPKIWTALNETDRITIERDLSSLLAKEYHEVQMYRQQNNVSTLLEGIVSCQPLPVLRPHLVQYLGSRWRAWHLAFSYFELRTIELHRYAGTTSETTHTPTVSATTGERQDIIDAQAEMFRLLREKDYFASLRKQQSTSESGNRALTFEQVSLFPNAINLYSGLLKEWFQIPGASFSSGNESLFWEEGWINSSRSMCQWDVLTEFARTVMNYELLHECLWRIPEWSGMKEALVRNPIDEGPLLRLYQAYVNMQENKMDAADGSINQGLQRVIERYCGLPDVGDLDAKYPFLVNLQQFVELQESSTIFEELNALSGHSTKTISIEQKVENIRLRLNTWRERLPFEHEPLSVWSDITTWRNHMHAVIVNVLETLKETASVRMLAASGNSSTGAPHTSAANVSTPRAQTQAASIAQSLPHQVLLMGINETAWNIHRFSKASRKQGFPEMALHAMNKLYPFGTMDLNEYFTKTKELTRSFLARPAGVDKCIENGLFELNRCNMEHFGKRQKAQLFTIKSKLLTELGREDEAFESLQVGLNTALDVGSTWLAWGRHCDKKYRRIAKENEIATKADSAKVLTENEYAALNNFRYELSWREAAANCYVQAIRFGSRSARPFLSRVLRLLTVDINSRFVIESVLFKHSLKDVLVKCTQSSDDRVEEWNTSLLRWTPRSGVSKVIMNSNEVPLWMWLPWLPQMIYMLSRKEGQVVGLVLKRIVHSYPQASFYLLLSFLEERKLIDKPKKMLHKDIIKQGRPLLPPSRGSVSVQIAQNFKQLQNTKDTVQRASVRLNALKKQRENLEKRLLATKDPAEEASIQVQIAKTGEDHAQAYQVLQRNLNLFQQCRNRHQTLMTEAQKVGAAQPNDCAARNDGSTAPKGVGDTWDGAGNRQDESGHDSSSNMKAENGTSHSCLQSRSQEGGETTEQEGRIDHGERTPFELADVVMTQLVKSHPILCPDLERITMELSQRLKPQREEHLLNLMSALLHRCYHSQPNSGKEVSPSYKAALVDVARTCFRTGLTSEGNSEQRLPASILEVKRAFENELAPQTAESFPKDLETFITLLRRWKNIFTRRVNSFPGHIRMESVSKYLLVDVNDTDIEVFGQYSDYNNREPVVDKHVKIATFGAKVEFPYGSYHTCRGLTVIGKDGKPYKFHLETSVKFGVEPAEERLAQIFHLLNNWVFSRNPEAVRRRVRLHVPKLVPIGPRTRLTSVEGTVSAASEGLEKYLAEHGCNQDDAIMNFRRIANDKLMQIGEKSRCGLERWEQLSVGDVMTSRVEAFNEICDNHLPDSCLSDWVDSKMLSANHMFSFRKRFAESLGTACVVGHCLGVGARRPQNLMFSWSSGAISNLYVRVLTSQEGLLESDEAVPFRLTRNMVKLMGPLGVEGPLKASMMSTIMALGNDLKIVRMFLDVIIRDELTAWVSSKVASIRKVGEVDQRGKDGSAMQDNVKVSGSAIATNADEILLLDEKAAMSLRGIMKRIGTCETLSTKKTTASGGTASSGAATTNGASATVSNAAAVAGGGGSNSAITGVVSTLSDEGGVYSNVDTSACASSSVMGAVSSSGVACRNGVKDRIAPGLIVGGGGDSDDDDVRKLNVDEVYDRISQWLKEARLETNLAKMEASWEPWY